jgi:hypothetical protein
MTIKLCDCGNGERVEVRGTCRDCYRAKWDREKRAAARSVAANCHGFGDECDVLTVPENKDD